MENAALTAFIVVIGGAWIAWTIWTRKKQRANWILVSESLGLEYVDDYFNPSIVGSLEGFQVHVCVEARGGKNSRQQVTVFRVDIADLPQDLSIEDEWVGAKVAKLFGSQDVQLGLPKLDSRLLIKAQDADAVREWAQGEGVAKGLRKLSNLNAFRIRQNTLSFEEAGAWTDPEKIKVSIRKLASIAALVSPTKPKLVQTDSNQSDDHEVPEGDEAEDNLW
jgi:hypothetical protein